MNDVKPKNACYKCEERKVGCHSTCPDYKKYRSFMDESAKKMREQKEKESMVTRTMIEIRRSKTRQI